MHKTSEQIDAERKERCQKVCTEPPAELLKEMLMNSPVAHCVFRQLRASPLIGAEEAAADPVMMTRIAYALYATLEDTRNQLVAIRANGTFPLAITREKT